MPIIERGFEQTGIELANQLGRINGTIRQWGESVSQVIVETLNPIENSQGIDKTVARINKSLKLPDLANRSRGDKEIFVDASLAILGLSSAGAVLNTDRKVRHVGDEVSKKEGKRGISRREFIKDVGVVSASIVLSSLAVTRAEASDPLQSVEDLKAIKDALTPLLPQGLIFTESAGGFYLNDQKNNRNVGNLLIGRSVLQIDPSLGFKDDLMNKILAVKGILAVHSLGGISGKDGWIKNDKDGNIVQAFFPGKWETVNEGNVWATKDDKGKVNLDATVLLSPTDKGYTHVVWQDDSRQVWVRADTGEIAALNSQGAIGGTEGIVTVDLRLQMPIFGTMVLIESGNNGDTLVYYDRNKNRIGYFEPTARAINLDPTYFKNLTNTEKTQIAQWLSLKSTTDAGISLLSIKDKDGSLRAESPAVDGKSLLETIVPSELGEMVGFSDTFIVFGKEGPKTGQWTTGKGWEAGYTKKDGSLQAGSFQAVSGALEFLKSKTLSVHAGLKYDEKGNPIFIFLNAQGKEYGTFPKEANDFKQVVWNLNIMNPVEQDAINPPKPEEAFFKDRTDEGAQGIFRFYTPDGQTRQYVFPPETLWDLPNLNRLYNNNGGGFRIASLDLPDGTKDFVVVDCRVLENKNKNITLRVPSGKTITRKVTSITSVYMREHIHIRGITNNQETHSGGNATDLLKNSLVILFAPVNKPNLVVDPTGDAFGFWMIQ
ncbi:MAG: hypothetical protein V1858_00135 [Candidatus Gottesmanbacteria bacterium]